MGVGAATVRRWTAAGRLQAFVTPGGHRRYHATDVLKLIGRPGRAPQAFSAEELGTLWGARESSAAKEARTEGWYGAYSEAEKAAARDHGHAVLQLAARYVANPAERDQIEREMAPLAVAYAEQAARVGVSLGDLLRAFGHFRRPMYAVVQAPGEVTTGPAVAAFAPAVMALAEFLDRFTLAAIETFVKSVLDPLAARLQR